MLDNVQTNEANEFLMSSRQLACIYEAAVDSQSYSPESFSLSAGENESFLLHMLGIQDVQIFCVDHFRKQAGPG